MSSAPTILPHTRPATVADAPELTAILNRIIEAGGTTAHQTPLTPDRMLGHYITPNRNISCIVAEAEDGQLLGFQSLVWPNDDGAPFPDGWAIIASFVDADGARQGLGRMLFSATSEAARDAGVTTIDATIRADNTGGLAYYAALGFEEYDVIAAAPLRDGNRIDRIRKRINLA